MTPEISLASAARRIFAALAFGPRPSAGGAPPHDFHGRMQRLTGLLFITTLATSIPPVVFFHAKPPGDPAFIPNGGFGRMTTSGQGGDVTIRGGTAQAFACRRHCSGDFPWCNLKALPKADSDV